MRDQAIELASKIVNLWETFKDFDMIVSEVHDYVVDCDTATQSRIESLERDLAAMKEKLDCLDT
jgi:hypothetical protein